jgi:transcriptional regulator with XRE-family HTH domain
MIARRKRKTASLREALRTNLVVTRAQRELSQAALAKAAGVSRQVVSDVERGVANVTFDTIERLAKALRVTPFVLVEPLRDNNEAGDDELAERLASHEFVSAKALDRALKEVAKTRKGIPRRQAAAVEGRTPSGSRKGRRQKRVA